MSKNKNKHRSRETQQKPQPNSHRTKSLLKNPALLAAIVGAAALVAVALIDNADRWFSNDETAIVDASRDEYLRGVDIRVDSAVKKINSLVDTQPITQPLQNSVQKPTQQPGQEAAQESTKRQFNIEFFKPITKEQAAIAKAQLESLRLKHRQAIEQGRMNEAGELLREINKVILDTGLDKNYIAKPNPDLFKLPGSKQPVPEKIVT
jgi:hypothetical protein